MGKLPIKAKEGNMKQKNSWKVTDAFYKKAEPLVPRKVLEAIFYVVLRTGIQ
jgi:hypothetical protein